MPAPSKKRVIVVGGGLAGLACVIKLAEEGVPVDLFSMVPVKRSHSVCAGRHQRLQRHRPAAGILRVDALRRDGSGRRLSCRSAASAGDVQLGAEDHRPARSHGRAVQSHARGPARSAPLRRIALQAHVLRRRDDRAAVALRPRRTDPPLGDRRPGQQVRVLGIPLAGPARRRSASASSRRTCGRCRSSRFAPMRS